MQLSNKYYVTHIKKVFYPTLYLKIIFLMQRVNTIRFKAINSQLDACFNCTNNKIVVNDKVPTVNDKVPTNVLWPEKSPVTY